MKRMLIVTMSLLLVSVVFYVFGCGEIDPALAPAGASVMLVGLEDDLQVPYECDKDWSLPDPCFNVFREYCIDTCVDDMIGGSYGKYSDAEENAYKDCIDDYDEQDCAEAVCDSQYNAWITACKDGGVFEDAQNYIRSERGTCGYISYLVSSVVEGVGAEVIAEGGETVTSPLNGVEVRWTVSAGELYKPSDIPTEVLPLSNPYYDESDERGLSEVKYRIPLPVRCDVTQYYMITSSIGVSQDSANIVLSVTDAEDTVE